MLIYHLTLGQRPSCTYYLHDPTDPTPPLVFVSNSPSWVENQARRYASNRLRSRVGSVVGIYIDLHDEVYMIATYQLTNSLFIPLPRIIPLTNSTTFYSTIQLSNVRTKLFQLLLTSIPRHTTPYHLVLALLNTSSNEAAFIDLTHDERTEWFEHCQYFLDH